MKKLFILFLLVRRFELRDLSLIFSTARGLKIDIFLCGAVFSYPGNRAEQYYQPWSTNNP